MSNLEKLAERLEAASGPDRELDEDIYTAVFGKRVELPRNKGEEQVFGWRVGPGLWFAIPTKLTESTDAAIDMIRQAVPNWTIARVMFNQNDDKT